MELSDFNSFIGFGATLSLAFVAVEYAKQYPFIVANRVFNFDDKIDRNYKENIDLIDEPTIDGLGELTINGCNAALKIEGLKRDKEIVIRKLQDKKMLEKEYVKEKCNSKSYSSLSFFMFLFALSTLFIAGLKNNNDAKFYWSIFVAFSFIHILLAWILGECQKKKYWLNYASLRTTIYCFIGITIFSLILFFILDLFTDLSNYVIDYYNLIVLLTIFTPYINFLVYTYKIKRKSKEINKHIDDTFSTLKAECMKIKNQTAELSAAQNLAINLKMQESDNSVQITEQPIKKRRCVRR